MKGQRFYKHLRNKKIDYSMGRFFVTMQVEHNRSILGTIVGEECILNELGNAVQNELTSLPQKYPELELGEFIVMPNHLHAIFTIKERTTNKKNHLGFLVGRFKGSSTFLYGKLKQAGKAHDIGAHLWQIDYWEDLFPAPMSCYTTSDTYATTRRTGRATTGERSQHTCWATRLSLICPNEHL